MHFARVKVLCDFFLVVLDNAVKIRDRMQVVYKESACDVNGGKCCIYGRLRSGIISSLAQYLSYSRSTEKKYSWYEKFTYLQR